MRPCPASSAPLWKNLALVVVYATAMGLLEAICVVYLRQLLLPGGVGQIEVAAMDRYYSVESWREACTVVMLLAVGWLAGTTLATRFGFFVAAFGIWDIWYYVGLYLWTGWPGSLLEWDCLFLSPCPWYGPVLAPVLISLSFLVLLRLSHRGRACGAGHPANPAARGPLGAGLGNLDPELHLARSFAPRQGISGKLSLVGHVFGDDPRAGRHLADEEAIAELCRAELGCRPASGMGSQGSQFQH